MRIWRDATEERAADNKRIKWVAAPTYSEMLKGFPFTASSYAILFMMLRREHAPLMKDLPPPGKSLASCVRPTA